jgi:hypothetical protein
MGEISSSYEGDNRINGGTPCTDDQNSEYDASVHGQYDEGHEESY